MENLKKTIEENGILYKLDEATQTYIPQLAVPEEKPLGKYGRMRREFLKKYRKGTYQALIGSGKLNEHCAEIDKTANEYLGRIVRAYAKADGLTEDMKNTDPMKWIGLMNNYKSCAEEFIFSELIYS